MLWLIYAIMASTVSGIGSVFHRVIMVEEDTLSYACILSLVGALFYIPFLIKEFALPSELLPWAIVLLASVVWTATAYYDLESVTHSPISIKKPFDQIRMIFVLFLSVILLSDALTTNKLVGTLVMFIGLITLTYQRKGFFSRLREKSVVLLLVASLLYAIVSIIDKYALNFFTEGTYGFVVFLIPGLLFIPFLRKKKAEYKQLMRNRWKMIFVAGLFAVLSYYFRLKALALADASLVFPITRMGILISVFSGIIFLKERKHVWRKVIASVIIIVGASILAGAFNI